MRKRLLLAGLVVAGLVFGVAHGVNAQSFRSGPNASVKNGETVDATVYAAGSTVEIAGTINGDLFCAGQSVHISGTVSGDVMCAGQTVTISGSVGGDIRAAGQTVTVSGTVGSNISVAGQTVTIASSAAIGGDATIGGADAVIGGSIGRDIVLGSSNATVEGKVGRNIQAEVEKLRLTGSAIVNGSLTYTSRNDAVIDSQARITGGQSHSLPPAESSRRAGFGAGSIVALLVFLSALLGASLLLVAVVPQILDKTAVKTLREPLKTFGVGVLFLFMAPVVVFVLFISIIGIPLAIMALLLWLLILMVSGPFFAYLIGKALWRRQDSAVLIMLLGSIVVLVGYLVPIVQFIAFLAAGTMGTGMVVLAIKRHWPRPVYKVAPTQAK